MKSFVKIKFSIQCHAQDVANKIKSCIHYLHTHTHISLVYAHANGMAGVEHFPESKLMNTYSIEAIMFAVVKEMLNQLWLFMKFNFQKFE